jgi:hypothetical protein
MHLFKDRSKGRKGYSLPKPSESGCTTLWPRQWSSLHPKSEETLQITAGKWKVPNLDDSSRYYGSSKYLMLQVPCVFSSRAELTRTSPFREVSSWACLFHETLARSLTSIGRVRPQDGDWQFSDCRHVWRYLQ